MNQRQVNLFIAMSLDGYIAKENGDLGFLAMVDNPPEDYGYAKFNESVDTVIIGRKTYEKVLSFGIDWPYKHKCYVLSSSYVGHTEHVEFYNGPVKDLIANIRLNEGKDIYCDGGSEIIKQLFEENLVDNLTISVIPILLGSGIRLFPDGRPELRLQLVSSQAYPTGLVQLCYKRVESHLGIIS